ncbi:hypothetical protein GCM10009863_53870 [Streptomyces axinellae]|uniref:Uncharacterized protein n=1 Tax=Streptomyces axinellae TaxID=552788 RepID=A0ABP6D611_9ACTN
MAGRVEWVPRVGRPGGQRPAPPPDPAGPPVRVDPPGSHGKHAGHTRRAERAAYVNSAPDVCLSGTRHPSHGYLPGRAPRPGTPGAADTGNR